MAFQSSYLSEDGVLLNLTWNDTSPVGYSATKAAPSLYQWDDAAWVMSACFIIFGKGPFNIYINALFTFLTHTYVPLVKRHSKYKEKLAYIHKQLTDHLPTSTCLC